MSEALLSSHLADQLQDLTEALAASNTLNEVLTAVLHPAVAALSAVSGTVLLLDPESACLFAAARQGAQSARTVWQNGPLTSQTPAGDALLSLQPSYFEDAGELTRLYPQLEAQTGGLSAVASAVLPLVAEGRALGVMILDFREPHSFTPQERRFLTTLAAQTALALQRAELLTRLREMARGTARQDQLVSDLQTTERRLSRQVEDGAADLLAEQLASRAFVQFTEAAGRATDVDGLARLALDVLEQVIPGHTAVLYTRGKTVWQPVHWSAALPPALLAEVQPGLPLDFPSFAPAVHTRTATFIDDWNGSEQGLDHAEIYHTVAIYPVVQDDEVRLVLTLALPTAAAWTAPQRAIVQAVGRSFTLLYDRIAATQEMQRQRDDAESRNRALTAFSALTGALDVRQNRYELIRRTQELVLSLLPPGYAAYWEPENGLWRSKVQVGDVGLPALQAVLDAGVGVGATPTLDVPMETGEPHFVDVYDKATDIDPGLVGHLNAVACLPIFIRGRFVGIFNVPLFETRVWDATDRSVLMAAVQSLTLALEGAQSLADLAQQAAKLETQAAKLAASNSSLLAANEELEAFTYSASHDLRTPVRHVMGFAQLAEKAVAAGQYEKVGPSLDVVKQGALRMNALIDGMLLLSRSGRQALQLQPVDLNALVTQARRDADTEFGAHPVRWQIGNLPTVQGDAQLLQQVMTNLLSNAVKYSARREVSEVRVWAQESPSEWTVSVQDNGVGFHPDYAQRLFGIFQRLHTEKDFKGVGVGLATVKRIVQKHGGRVFAESDGTSGATFGFTLSN